MAGAPPLVDTSTLAKFLTYGTLVGVFVVDSIMVWAYGGEKSKRSEDRGTFLLIQLTTVVGILLGIMAASYLRQLAITADRWATLWVGVVLMVAGGALRVWSVMALGPYFRRVVAVEEGHRVIDSGPYQYVRHPSYTAVLLALTGFGLALGNWASVVACLVVPLVGYLQRIRVEERALSRALGEEYDRYARGRPRLIPPLVRRRMHGDVHQRPAVTRTPS